MNVLQKANIINYIIIRKQLQRKIVGGVNLEINQICVIGKIDEFFKFIKGDKTILEKNPLEIAAKKGEMHAFKHKNFWHCMDTKRDRDVLEQFYKEKKFIWSK